MRSIATLTLGLAASGLAQEDPREAYDAEAYRLDVRLEPERRRIEGTVSIELVVLEEQLERVRLDMVDDLKVERVLYARGPLLERGPARGKVLFHTHEDAYLDCHLPHPLPRGKRITVAVTYSGNPGELDGERGLRWAKGDTTLIDVSVQNAGAHLWFPCKASRFHPEDRPRRVLIDATVPDGLVAAACGRFLGRDETEEGWVTWRWQHEYPVPTYGIAVSVGPYESVTERLALPGHDEGVQLQYFVLPGDLAAARTQFAELEELLTVYSRAFGPWPFPRSKVGVAQGSWMTVDHSTLLSYGSTFPAWRAAQGEPDPLAKVNGRYDYVLVHQLAHEWWGNAVGAASWRDAWLHEGFATFAEGLWVEHREGREGADDFFLDLARRVRSDLPLIRPEAEADAARAFVPVLYLKGAWVLHLARHYIADDELFFGALHRFQATHRYGVATTADLRLAFEEETGEDWGRFFDEWVYGRGMPRLQGEVRVFPDRLEVAVVNQVSAGGSFRVPLDLQWEEEGEAVRHRLWLEPGSHEATIPCADPSGVAVVDLRRLLGRHRVQVVDGSGPAQR